MWVFGLLIALGLVVSESYILSLVVVGGLVVFGLRSKETARGPEATPASPDQSTDSEAASSIAGLRNVTPHTFAAVIVGLIPDNRPPFNTWRPDPDVVPEKADAVCEMFSRAYQLKILLDLIIQKFGEPIAHLVEASLLSLLEVGSKSPFFGSAFAMVDRARALGPVAFEDILLDERLRLDVQVTDQMLTAIAEADRGQIRFPTR